MKTRDTVVEEFVIAVLIVLFVVFIAWLVAVHEEPKTTPTLELQPCSCDMENEALLMCADLLAECIEYNNNQEGIYL